MSKVTALSGSGGRAPPQALLSRTEKKHGRKWDPEGKMGSSMAVKLVLSFTFKKLDLKSSNNGGSSFRAEKILINLPGF